MIQQLSGIGNDHVVVTMIDLPYPAILICERDSNRVLQCFSGFDGLENLFYEFKENINENIDAPTAISFFKTKANRL